MAMIMLAIPQAMVSIAETLTKSEDRIPTRRTQTWQTPKLKRPKMSKEVLPVIAAGVAHDPHLLPYLPTTM